MRTLTSRSIRRLLLWALALKAVWEWVQCAYLYDMSGSTLWKRAVWMSAATVADGFLMLAVAGIAALLGGKRHPAAPDAKGWAALLSSCWARWCGRL